MCLFRYGEEKFCATGAKVYAGQKTIYQRLEYVRILIVMFFFSPYVPVERVFITCKFGQISQS